MWWRLQRRGKINKEKTRFKEYDILRHLFGILAVGVNLAYTLIPGQATDGKDHHQKNWEICEKDRTDFLMSPDCLNCTNERFFESEALFNYHGVDNLAEANEKKCGHRLAAWPKQFLSLEKIANSFYFLCSRNFSEAIFIWCAAPSSCRQEAKCQISIQFIVSFQLFRHQ